MSTETKASSFLTSNVAKASSIFAKSAWINDFLACNAATFLASINAAMVAMSSFFSQENNEIERTVMRIIFFIFICC